MTHFLYLVRHAAADPHDGPLSEAGKEQARLTGQRLREVPFSGIHHGPLPRAAQTAELIAACLPGVPVSACDLAGDCRPAWSPSMTPGIFRPRCGGQDSRPG